MITYDTLIQEALDSYQDYLEADERVSRLNAILEKVGATVEAAADEEPSELEAQTADASPGGAPSSERPSRARSPSGRN
jgi:hypothetical protein